MKYTRLLPCVVPLVIACSADRSAPLAPSGARHTAELAAGVSEVSVWPLLIARGINDRGVTVGQISVHPNHRGGVRYPDGRVVTLDVLPGDTWSDAAAINNRGQVVGRSGNSTRTQAFIWDADRGMRALGTLGGGMDAPSAINDDGTVVGISQLVHGSVYPQSAFIWHPSTGISDLGARIGDSQASGAYDVNGNGEVVGTSINGPFVWSSTQGVHYLPAPQGAQLWGINRAGTIVGSAWNAAQGKNQALAWTARWGVNYIDPFSAEYGLATAISDDATIVGYFLINSAPHVFIRTESWAHLGLAWSQALAVNACGVAAGFSTAGGVIWVPVGLPATGACPR